MVIENTFSPRRPRKPQGRCRRTVLMAAFLLVCCHSYAQGLAVDRPFVGTWVGTTGADYTRELTLDVLDGQGEGHMHESEAHNSQLIWDRDGSWRFIDVHTAKRSDITRIELCWADIYGNHYRRVYAYRIDGDQLQLGAVLLTRFV
jgi:hypothetical protein